MRRNDYKESEGLRVMERRGQVAIFIIIAIVIVGAFVWLVVYPRIPTTLGGAEVNPTAYLRECLQSEFEPALERIMSQGGSITPTHALLYEGTSVEYLCYTDEDYKPCIVQQPLLVNHVALELQSYLEPRASSCMDALIARYRQQGYRVETGARAINVSIAPGSIFILYNAPMVVSKESTQTFRQFSVAHSTELYDLLMIATSIIQFESTLGDSETTYFMQYYPDLKIEKLKKNDDTIYTLTNMISNEKFTFATRSLIWPQGYGAQ